MLNDEQPGLAPLMSEAEVKNFLAAHRRLLKYWTLTAAGFRDGDGPTMRAELESNLTVLAEIARQHPQHAAAIVLLTDALSQGDKSGNTARPR